MAGIGDIRAIEAGAKRRLRDFEKAIKAIKKVMVKQSHIEGRKIHKLNARRYARGQYASEQGKLKRLGSYGVKWGKRKLDLRLDLRRGVAGKGILKQMQSPAAFKRLKDGFEIDPEGANITITRRATLGKSNRAIAGKRILSGKGANRQVIGIAVKFQNTFRRSFRVNNYLKHYAAKKAPGLGSATDKDYTTLERELAKAADHHIRSIKGASRGVSKKAQSVITLKLGRLVK